ncbi:hypothetical protein [Hominisplanchenecus sp.]|uniref:hypothetical protein n=1 Tax=Hominisplanchenecus sp. TaxID=3038130 RepID=UPI003995EB3E
MRTVPKNLTVEIKHYRDHRGCRYVCLEACDFMGRSRCSQSYMFDPHTSTWYVQDGTSAEVTQDHVFKNLLDAYKSMLSVEDLISENLTVAEEGY